VDRLPHFQRALLCLALSLLSNIGAASAQSKSLNVMKRTEEGEAEIWPENVTKSDTLFELATQGKL
jgi:hypothetical protein